MKVVHQFFGKSNAAPLGKLQIYRNKAALPLMNQTVYFVVCVANKDYPASLDLHKVYCVLPDADAAADGDLRIIDESGEDYLYPADCFLPLDVKESTEKVLRESFMRWQTAVS